MAADVDVVIVGAGAAGLAAAKTLKARGRTFRLLEARDRIGGRAWTDSTRLGQPFDIGCAWLHAADRNPFYDEAKAAGRALSYHCPGLERVYQGRKLALDDELAQIAAQEEAFLDALEGGAPGDRASAIRVKGAGGAVGTYLGPMDFGADLDEISVADLASAADLEPNYLVAEGFGTLVADWGADVEVSLNTPVTRIRWDGPGVVAETPRGDVTAEKAIVTVSTGVLAFGGIRFTPDLPEETERAIHSLPMGLLAKIPLEIRGDRLGLSPFDDVLVERYGHHDIYFLAFPFDTDLLVGFVGGDFAWEITAAGEAAAVDFATQSLERLFGSDVRGRIGRSLLTPWGADPWTRGAYAAARPGQSAAREVLGRPVGDRIWFAGEALGGPLKQTCAGARLSGERVAGVTGRFEK